MANKNQKSKTRIKRSDEFKAEALKSVDSIGVVTAARERDNYPS